MGYSEAVSQLSSLTVNQTGSRALLFYVVCVCVCVCVCVFSSSGCKVLLHFVNQSGMKTSVSAMEGESLLEVVINKNLQIDGFGACEGTLACSTCHLIFEDGVYEKMEPMADEEMDMLDLAYGLTKLSRLGCQVTVERWMDGMTVRVPQEVKDRREKPEAEI
uniref:2Fe-2S ferredoxin-type domain-containing protein n=1 Tax=Pygocentrus nattereri TaxID=42514 RepID=A0AAR2L6U7_PYGNA